MADEKQPSRKGKKKEKQAPPPKRSSGWSESASRARKDRQRAKREEKLAKLRAKREAAGVTPRVKPPRLTDAEWEAKYGKQSMERNDASRKFTLADRLPAHFVLTGKPTESADREEPMDQLERYLAKRDGVETVSIPTLVVLTTNDPALLDPELAKRVKRSEAAKKAAETRKRNKAAKKSG
ncbi:MAG: hypothetical protein L0312_20665 [Acidobacteria bacterium]|nr:hypothetical protein [Acidobacteriota bacterium]